MGRSAPVDGFALASDKHPTPPAGGCWSPRPSASSGTSRSTTSAWSRSCSTAGPRPSGRTCGTSGPPGRGRASSPTTAASTTVQHLRGVGHFTPVEAPEALAAAVRRALGW
jgi:hypothetical protein